MCWYYSRNLAAASKWKKRLHESCHTYESVILKIQMIHVIDMNVLVRQQEFQGGVGEEETPA